MPPHYKVNTSRRLPMKYFFSLPAVILFTVVSAVLVRVLLTSFMQPGEEIMVLRNGETRLVPVGDEHTSVEVRAPPGAPLTTHYFYHPPRLTAEFERAPIVASLVIGERGYAFESLYLNRGSLVELAWTFGRSVDFELIEGLHAFEQYRRQRAGPGVANGEGTASPALTPPPHARRLPPPPLAKPPATVADTVAQVLGMPKVLSLLEVSSDSLAAPVTTAADSQAPPVPPPRAAVMGSPLTEVRGQQTGSFVFRAKRADLYFFVFKSVSGGVTGKLTLKATHTNYDVTAAIEPGEHVLCHGTCVLPVDGDGALVFETAPSPEDVYEVAYTLEVPIFFPLLVFWSLVLLLSSLCCCENYLWWRALGMPSSWLWAGCFWGPSCRCYHRCVGSPGFAAAASKGAPYTYRHGVDDPDDIFDDDEEQESARLL